MSSCFQCDIFVFVIQVGLQDLMDTVDENLQYGNGKLLGLYSALSHLVAMYRWGQLPVTEEEKNRTSLKFPAEISQPFEKVNMRYTYIFGDQLTMFSCPLTPSMSVLWYI